MRISDWSSDVCSSDLPERIVLAVDLHGSLDEGSPLDPLAAVFPEDAVLGLIDVVDTLDRGAADGRVTGAVFDLSGAALGLAQTQELRAAVFRFRAAGKTAEIGRAHV